MGKVLWIAAFAIALGACNSGKQEEGATTTTDTAAHSARQDGSDEMGTGGTGVVMSADTARMAGGSLMAIMQTNMDQIEGTPSAGDPDTDFATMMKTHHLGSMEMARMQLAQGTDPDLKKMAQKMMNTQQKEVEELNRFISGSGAQGAQNNQGGSTFHQQALNTVNQMKMDTTQTTGSVDKQFARLMAEHHRSGIKMSEAFMKHSQDEDLKSLASKIKSGQQMELQKLKGWLGKNQ